jgi:hypothetical protein
VGTRDRYLWNVAADYVVNGWLVEMGIGEAPDGLLHDAALAGLSVEAVYDRIARDLRRLRRLGTLRGRGLGDILTEPVSPVGDPFTLDDFYRRALTLGLANHQTQGRGLLPAGLVAEIRVLDQPPLPWDARLARWFDEHVPAAVRRRSYARPSRRQASTPDIPRPGWYLPEELTRRVIFGVVLDTSGSMNHTLMGKALGAIASYAMAGTCPPRGWCTATRSRTTPGTCPSSRSRGGCGYAAGAARRSSRASGCWRTPRTSRRRGLSWSSRTAGASRPCASGGSTRFSCRPGPACHSPRRGRSSMCADRKCLSISIGAGLRSVRSRARETFEGRDAARKERR